MNYQIDAFDSWRLHESEIQVQSNQRFFFLAASGLVFAASRLSRSSLMRWNIKKNLWDQGSYSTVYVTFCSRWMCCGLNLFLV